MTAIVDPITAVLDAVKARVIEALGPPWRATKTMLPVSATALDTMVRRAPHALIGWTDWRGGGPTAKYSAPIKLQVILLARELDIEKATCALNASLCRLGVALRRQQVRAVTAGSVDPQPIGTLQLDGLAPAYVKGLSLEGYAMAAIDLSMDLTLDDWQGDRDQLPDFQGLDMTFSLGAGDTATDSITFTEGT